MYVYIYIYIYTYTFIYKCISYLLLRIIERLISVHLFYVKVSNMFVFT